MSRAGIDRLCSICAEVQARTYTRAELADHYASLARFNKRDLFTAAPTVGLIPGRKPAPPAGDGAAPYSLRGRDGE